MSPNSPKSPSRVSLMIELLNKTGRAMTVLELSEALNLPKAKIRQSIGPSFDLKIVRVGAELYDLPERVYPGKIFRYTPSWEEIVLDKFSAATDLSEILAPKNPIGMDICLVDEKNRIFNLRHKKHSWQRSHEDYLSGFKRWFKDFDFAFGDDIIFTCQNFSPSIFSIKRLPKESRDEAMITKQNKILADEVYKQLAREFWKRMEPLFLVPRYVFLLPFYHPVPPDSLFKVLADDPRFLVTDKLICGDGVNVINSWEICSRKYFFQNNQGLWVQVHIEQDELGKFGVCGQCYERMGWNKDKGWYHFKNDLDWVTCYLEKDFFDI